MPERDAIPDQIKETRLVRGLKTVVRGLKTVGVSMITHVMITHIPILYTAILSRASSIPPNDAGSHSSAKFVSIYRNLGLNIHVNVPACASA